MIIKIEFEDSLESPPNLIVDTEKGEIVGCQTFSDASAYIGSKTSQKEFEVGGYLYLRNRFTGESVRSLIPISGLEIITRVKSIVTF